ncbi:MAG: ABC transporter ATP-binding protein [Ilumatobacter fluminis]|uniref:ABC transporter ATP-binding protein n=1 Tax=Ilumatobacter fluminis TaxID=467091 RepID=UPI0032EB3B1F
MTPVTTPLAELSAITKVYPNGVVALRGVDLQLHTGEVHALLGENGAGKSTLVKVLFGLEEPSDGEVRIRGAIRSTHRPADAIAAGIGMVHQHFQLIPSLTVAENLVLGDEPTRRGLLDRSASRRLCHEVGARYGIELDPDARVGGLSVGDKQRLEILRALRTGADVLILDEPTAVLNPAETERLLETVRSLAADGTGIVLITHKLREVMAVADVVTVLRGGRVVTRVDRAATSIDELAVAMVGRDVERPVPNRDRMPGDALLELSGLTTAGPGRGRLGGVDLTVRSGEIVGVAGVEGNGQDDLIDAVAGLRPLASGDVRVAGRSVGSLSPRLRRRAGVAHVAADRMTRGAALRSSIADNFVADRFRRRPFSGRGWLRRPAIGEATRDAIDRFDIRTDSEWTDVGALSGGNIQKVVVARELDGEPAVVLAAHPTRGVDLGAMARIHEGLIAARDRGAAVVLVSSELDELRQVADRIVVLSGGSIVASFDSPAEATDDLLGRAMAGAAS